MPDNDNSIPMFKGTISYEAFGNLYLNITNQCSANCVFCIRDLCDGVYGYDLRLSREPTEEEIIGDLESHDLKRYNEVVFTGFGEPTCRFDTVLHITKWLHDKGIIVRLDTNGHAALMNPGRDVVAELKAAGLDDVSISLNAESEERYNELCKPAFIGSYAAMLDFAKSSVRLGIKTRMTVVGDNDIDIEKCESIATGIGASFRVR
ncbi:TatD family nuclease-associated radical SAM protein [Methanolobus profundi]|uniref:Radical SAM protein, TatD family-associated n=1 Tax=Methanolobus profundi TaxID=487685 RepID=A0A1I4PAM4_9EURY|nr:TatD family nuclease-associated radical SAM protein [Methanolobus profundi]SFM24695.1 radical SAM protein, TatD family-associated [Methanolobus profundi]